ncbi:MAG: RES domain-containing protein [Rubrobacter sp.]
MATGWRIVKNRRVRSAFDGEGARLYGGRWNSPGTRMVYVAGSVSLAVLEVLVHLGDARVLTSYSLCAVDFDDGLIEPLDRSRLPADWRSYPAPPGLREIGNAWVRGGSSTILEVPSAVVERESNYLINPEHPDFVSVNVGDPEPFEFDSRLL